MCFQCASEREILSRRGIKWRILVSWISTWAPRYEHKELWESIMRISLNFYCWSEEILVQNLTKDFCKFNIWPKILQNLANKRFIEEYASMEVWKKNRASSAKKKKQVKCRRTLSSNFNTWEQTDVYCQRSHSREDIHACR